MTKSIKKLGKKYQFIWPKITKCLCVSVHCIC